MKKWIFVVVFALVLTITLNRLSYAKDEDLHKINVETQRNEIDKSEDYAYSYNTLTYNEQTVYLEIKYAITKFEEITLSSKDLSTVDKLFYCVMNDNPDIFYANGYNYHIHNTGDICISGIYTFNKEEIAKKQKQIDAYVTECFNSIQDDFDDYEKIKYVYEDLINHTEYDSNAENHQNICSVFIEGKSVCQGYAKATQYLLNELGIPTTLVLGLTDKTNHAWNLVKVDGDYYYVDTTWGDSSYQKLTETAGYYHGDIPMINYDYLLVTTDQISSTHEISGKVFMPYCFSTKNNYYVREGLYLIDWDSNKAASIINQQRSDGSNYVTLKCENYIAYSNMRNELLDNGGIFKYVDIDRNSVSYIDNDRDYSISFIF